MKIQKFHLKIKICLYKEDTIMYFFFGYVVFRFYYIILLGVDKMNDWEIALDKFLESYVDKDCLNDINMKGVR